MCVVVIKKEDRATLRRSCSMKEKKKDARNKKQDGIYTLQWEEGKMYWEAKLTFCIEVNEIQNRKNKHEGFYQVLPLVSQEIQSRNI